VIRFTLSRFRTQAVLAGALLVVIAAVLGVTGPHLARLWDTTLGPCLAAHPAIAQLDPGPVAGHPCQLEFLMLRGVYAPYWWLRGAAGIAVLVVPALTGLFWGAPLIAPELHDGTWRLAWTQSITRTRWLAVKLGLIGAASIAVAGLLSLMVTWWAGPLDRLASLDSVYANSGRFNPLLFGERGLAPTGYAAFGFALGVTAGVLLRRTVPAMAVDLGGLAGARLAMTYWIRPHLQAPVHLTLPISPSSTPLGFGRATAHPGTGGFGGGGAPGAGALWGGPPGAHPGLSAFVSRVPNIQNALVFSDQLADKAGHPPSTQFLQHTACTALAAPGATPPAKTTNACIAQLAAHYHQLITLQPASRYWPFQAYETAIFTAAALLLAGICFWWIRRRLT